MKVQTYSFKASNGKHARFATEVIMGDGEVIQFIERLPKKQALKQASEQVLRAQQIKAGLPTMRVALGLA